MRQLIARIDDRLHARLKRRARREGRSINSIVIEALEAALRREELSPQGALRRRAHDLWPTVPMSGRRPDPVKRREVIERTRGIGSPVIDELERERRGER